VTFWGESGKKLNIDAFF